MAIRCIDGEYEPKGFEDIDEDVALRIDEVRPLFEAPSAMEKAQALAKLSMDRFDRLFQGRHRSSGINLRRAGKNVVAPHLVKLFISQRTPSRCVVAAGAEQHRGNVSAQALAASSALSVWRQWAAHRRASTRATGPSTPTLAPLKPEAKS